MALDALRSTFRRPGSDAAPMAPAGSAAPAAATFQPGTPTFPAAAPLWGQPPAERPAADDFDADATGSFDAVIAAVEAAREPYGLPIQPMTGPASESSWTVPPVEATPVAAVAAAVPAAPSSYATDQYAAVFADPIAGGGTDDAAFGCPTCGRTLDHGSYRCEGCGAWLLLDMPLKRAAMFVGGGLVAGIVVTVLLLNLFASPRPAPVAGPDAANPVGAGAVAAAEIPTGAVAALRGTTALNGRLADEATALRKALDAKKFKTGDVQKVLRRMAIDARTGVGMLSSLTAWPEAAGQQAALQAFYADLQRQIDTGLSASVRSTGAYKKAAKAVLSTLGTAPAIDTDARALAAQAGVVLVPVTFPKAIR